MPEIKHNFIGGKMNKDVDERLVPEGEYREAMNVQLSTSDSSDVGTIQNILPNNFGCTDEAGVPLSNITAVGTMGTTIGSVSDEKDDSLYWFVSGLSTLSSSVITPLATPPNNSEFATDINNANVDILINSLPVTPNNLSATLSLGTPYLFRDVIMGAQLEKIKASNSIEAPISKATCEPVFVDVWGFIIESYDPGTFGTGFTNIYNVGNENLANLLEPGWVMASIILPSSNSLTQNISVFGSAIIESVISNANDIRHVAPKMTGTGASPACAQLNGPPDVSGICYFPSYNNHQFVGINVGDEIGWSPHFPAKDETHTSGVDSSGNSYNLIPMCVNHIALGYYSNQIPTVGDGEIIIDDCNGNIILPLSDAEAIGDWFGQHDYCDTRITIKSSANTTIKLQSQIRTTSLGNNLPVMFYNPNRVLDFNIDKLITGINIIDDLLFWTDGDNEPKKININRSRQGTDEDGLSHTTLINDFVQPIGGEVLAREEHITVIKKPPTKNITVETEKFQSIDTSGYFTVRHGSSNPNEFIEAETGKTKSISFDDGPGLSATTPSNLQRLPLELNDVLRFSISYSNLHSEDYELRAVIIGIKHAKAGDPDGFDEGYQIFKLEILNIKDNTNTIFSSLNQNPHWKAVIENEGKRLFERKLPRFSYRYKYLDNEYSAIGPFTDVVFKPGEFRYHPIEAYNTAMINNLKSITLKDFVSSDMPADVKQIDLLYKNDTDPNIYIIDSITPKDHSAETTNAWNSNGTVPIGSQVLENDKFSTSGSYKIKTENIFATLPSNQSLRSWDNVPKKALAQEITGNRIVYGNYVQGYNLEDFSGKYQVPDIDISLQTRIIGETTFFGKKSIKSLRNYEIGVVWGDEYGRETPVITPSVGSLKVPKSRAQQSNFINLILKNSPDWADYYKFYIKETSNEYYNLALGRVYEDGVDDNIWLAFPSIDRNKVDEDTYLILKKGQGPDAKLITEDARYKIVAIENEAPEQIKTSYTKLVRTNTDDSRPKASCDMFGGVRQSPPSGVGVDCIFPQHANGPTPGMLGFTLDITHWTAPYDAGTGTETMGLVSPAKLFKEVSANPGQDQLWVGFSKEIPGDTPDFSSKYHVVDVDEPDLDATPATTINTFSIKLASPILSADEWVTDEIHTASDNIHVHFWKKSIDNKPEFDGRFFVKIHRDRTIIDNLITEVELVDSWAITTSTDAYNINSLPTGSSYTTISDGTGEPFGLTDDNTGSPKTRSEWEEALKFGGNETQGFWFIDNAYFAGKQPLASDTHDDSEVEFFDGIPALVGQASNTLAPMVTTYEQFSPLTIMGTINSFTHVIQPNPGTGLSTGDFCMKGNHNTNGEEYIDLAYSKIMPRGSLGFIQGFTSTIGGGFTTDYELNWEVGNPSVSATAAEQEIVEHLSINRKFKIKGNATIYKITGTQKFRLYNYRGRRSPHQASTDGTTVTSLIPLTTTLSSGSDYWSSLHREQVRDMHQPINRRLTYRIRYELDPESSSAGQDFPISQNSNFEAATNFVPMNIQFLTEFSVEQENKISTHPAIFETEPKEDLDLNLYYEASSNIPTLPINTNNRHMFIPIGATVELLEMQVNPNFPEGVFVVGWKNDEDGNHQIILSMELSFDYVEALITNGAKFVRDDGSFTSADIISGSNLSGNISTSSNVLNLIPTKKVGLGWYNCFSFNNGVESNRIGDTYNKPFTTNGAKASTTLSERIEEEHRKYGLIYSGIYNSNSGTNNLNQFIAAEKITKDINPIYGSIQKLYSRSTADGDLITLCEDRILKILANKDALYNADGNPQLIATDTVLGQTIPYSGDYGISKNPESFASESYRCYFTDKVRGTVMRLSKDGLTVISNYGMKDWFRDNLKLYTNLIGSYDDRKEEYNITLTHIKSTESTNSDTDI